MPKLNGRVGTNTKEGSWRPPEGLDSCSPFWCPQKGHITANYLLARRSLWPHKGTAEQRTRI
eukprot:3730843-Pyramimonas_sp.AAC.1